MKNVLIIIVVLIILGLGGFFWYTNSHIVQAPSPTPLASQTPIASSTPSGTPQTSATSASPAANFCTPSKLQAQMAPQGAAGNIYADITIKNTSTSSCDITGNNMITATIPQAVMNITTSQKTQPAFPVFTLAPNQTVYSQLHYPNGPQCQGSLTMENISFSYKISPTDTVTFKTPTGTTMQVPSCSTTDKTNIDLWALSDTKITP